MQTRYDLPPAIILMQLVLKPLRQLQHKEAPGTVQYALGQYFALFFVRLWVLNARILAATCQVLFSAGLHLRNEGYNTNLNMVTHSSKHPIQINKL